MFLLLSFINDMCIRTLLELFAEKVFSDFFKQNFFKNALKNSFVLKV